jgi:hypothetical protein
MFESESRRFEKPKKPIDVIFDSRDGLVFWQIKYDDGSMSKPEAGDNLTSPAAIKQFREEKYRELNIGPAYEEAA